MGFACILRSAVLLLAISPAAAGELDFVQVDRIPAPQGTAQPTETFHAPRQGLAATRTRYHQDLGETLVISHRVEATCGRHVFAPRLGAAMLAIQAVPKRPTSARAADLHNRFVAAYVRDERGRVRLYENLTVLDLTRLTEQFLPRCTVL